MLNETLFWKYIWRKYFNFINRYKKSIYLFGATDEVVRQLQEKIISKNIAKFKKGIFIGVGGTFDVLSGAKKRAPKLFIQLNLEWLYRIVREPKRIKRFFKYNIKFLYLVNKEQRKKRKIH